MTDKEYILLLLQENLEDMQEVKTPCTLTIDQIEICKRLINKLTRGSYENVCN
jgi:hypothetical protein